MHLTNEQLNEYLDNASTERAFIETHLDSCGECVARLSNLQALFADLDSLPEATLSRDIAARFRPRPSLASQLPRWLTLTASLQAASALVALIVAIPFFSIMLPKVELPSFTTWFFEIQSLWTSWLDQLSTFQMPTFQPSNIPTLEMSTLFIALAIVSIFWIFGNGLLLRNNRS
ncbi:MAG: hypothetical protein IPG80_07850 [Anaerolineales bacterium]|uniref:anti-sigma factor family protein n=1 Tax=Candidatus Villigracilis vicinus TaxID=3140679 RepID=UPI003135ED42|nr:hypothetical protein [Anaerolineales bacterium]